MKNGSRVHCVTLDAAKAFDKVLHCGLFYQMISKGVHILLHVQVIGHSRACTPCK